MPIRSGPQRLIDLPPIRGPRIEAGAHSYHAGMRVWYFDEATWLRVGKYCSVAPEVAFLLGGEHHPEAVSTYPFYASDPALLEWAERSGLRTKGDIVIGSDVWIGFRAVILSGVKIGDGAVIGAGAVVTQNVPPYAIVGGSPARIIRYRHTPEQIERLLQMRWWDWDDDAVHQVRQDLLSPDIARFLDKYGENPPKHSSSPFLGAT